MPELILAPIHRVRPCIQILDSGTADGIWLTNISTELDKPPSCTGADISPHLFPPHPSENIQYIAQSIKNDWSEDLVGKFDLVHRRLVLVCCNTHEANQAVMHLAHLTRPGGWVQSMECDHSGAFGTDATAKNPALVKFGQLVMPQLATKGQCAQQGLHLKQYLKNAGHDNVIEMTYDIPVGKTAENREVGDVAAENLVHVAMKMQGSKEFVQQLSQELCTVGGTQRFHVVYGLKPVEKI
ncbi:hypothetical protein N7491_007879 [Penicillium cf. griseofulvum]|uniref:Methyltransferase domain-containing protein n=1 Tax=Penicillium cf. griseofulvum TaxID=2972120 RepID=A0A9W9J3R5_9EURO|nr:hypothetical protein N7472_009093 [Penicillium cf. griseofulvum]KAJ5427437.1 hypothetical protein N7491_007879 [Penicillium cf. griseofulvum]KAJ5431637.1 hypothetical protein N7445_008135 [Penicillium cf. griseofulvum]